MTQNRNHRQGTTGEAIIGRAFRRSLLAILMLAAFVAAFFFYVNRKPDEPAPVAEAEVTGPALPTPEAAGNPPAVSFTDITETSGIDFVHVSGAYGERLMPETIGSGLAFLDYDNDGDPDLFLANSTYWPGHKGAAQPRQALYQNDGKGGFTEVTESVGLSVEAYAMGAAVGDYDNDGWVDLYLYTLKENILFRNENGRFRDVSESAGVAGRQTDWSTGAAFIDYDNDGDLDLFVANYVKWSRKRDLEIDFRLTGLGRAYGSPNHFDGVNNMLFRNDGGGRFTEVTSSAGIKVEDPVSGSPVGKGLAVAPIDYDRDGWIDLFIANDTVRNFLFRNKGDGSFEEIGAFEGIAYDRDGKATGAMGIDAAYFRNDLDLGVAIGNFANEMSSLYTTVDGRPPFADEAVLEGLGPASRLALTFGVFFFDYDLDGRLDYFQANGHLEHEINKVQPSQHYAQPAQLFWNCGPACRGRFVNVKDTGDLSRPLVGRGAVYADIDGDGDLDLAVSQTGRKAVLYRNEQSLNHHWLRIKLVGTRSNRDAIGAWIEVDANGVTQRRQVMPTRSYMSQVELPVTFGLGTASRADEIRITWPDGGQQKVTAPEIDKVLVVEQSTD